MVALSGLLIRWSSLTGIPFFRFRNRGPGTTSQEHTTSQIATTNGWIVSQQDDQVTHEPDTIEGTQTETPNSSLRRSGAIRRPKFPKRVWFPDSQPTDVMRQGHGRILSFSSVSTDIYDESDEDSHIWPSRPKSRLPEDSGSTEGSSGRYDATQDDPYRAYIAYMNINDITTSDSKQYGTSHVTEASDSTKSWEPQDNVPAIWSRSSLSITRQREIDRERTPRSLQTALYDMESLFALASNEDYESSSNDEPDDYILVTRTPPRQRTTLRERYLQDAYRD